MRMLLASGMVPSSSWMNWMRSGLVRSRSSTGVSSRMIWPRCEALEPRPSPSRSPTAPDWAKMESISGCSMAMRSMRSTISSVRAMEVPMGMVTEMLTVSASSASKKMNSGRPEPTMPMETTRAARVAATVM
jgi:hypothetical protein